MFRAVKLGIWLAVEVPVFNEEEESKILKFVQDGTPVLLAQTFEQLMDAVGEVELVEGEEDVYE
jgi:hypothetical protein